MVLKLIRIGKKLEGSEFCEIGAFNGLTGAVMSIKVKSTDADLRDRVN